MSKNTISNSKRYIAKMTQSSTNAPVLTVVLNELTPEKTPVAVAYSSTGVYTLILEGAFPAAQTSIKTSMNDGGNGTVRASITDDDTITLTTKAAQTLDTVLVAPVVADGVLSDCLIEIEVQYS